MQRVTQKEALCSQCLLARSCFPASFSREEFVLFDKVTKKHINLQKKNLVYCVGDPVKYVYIVKSGSVKSHTFSQNGSENIIDFYFPGDIVGIESLGMSHHQSNAITLQESSICTISLKDLLMLCSKIHSLHYKLIKLIGQQLAFHIAMHIHAAAEEKVALFLIRLAEQIKKMGHSNCEYDLSMTRQDIGNYLGLATETISRIFSHFQKNRMINVQNRHILIDKSKLYKVCHL